MRGVTFGTIHSYNDLGLILNTKTIGAAKAKTSTIDVPGVDGEFDCTEYFGDVKYYNRELSFEFSTIAPPSEFLSIYSNLQNLFNGRKMQITLDDDPDYYYIGRVTVNEWASNKRIGKIVIDVNAHPYKLKQTATVISSIVSSKTVINCPNSRMQVIPIVTSTKEVKVEFGNYAPVFTGEMPENYAEELIFGEGENFIIVTPLNGDAVVTVEYREGEL